MHYCIRQMENQESRNTTHGTLFQSLLPPVNLNHQSNVMQPKLNLTRVVKAQDSQVVADILEATL